MEILTLTMDRGDVASQGRTGATAMQGPRVGGVVDGVVWTGGSNIPTQQQNAPEDVLCFRPAGFKEMQKQHENLKRGLDVSQKLEFVDGNKTTVGLTMWITCMMMMLTQYGMDTVFKIWDQGTNEVDILKNWGKTTMERTKAWIEVLHSSIGDKYDKENLRLSGFVVRASLGPNLLNRVISLAGATATGPELFLTAVHQVSYMTASLVRSVCNKICGLQLKKIPGENVAKLGEIISELVKQIECSGETPQDLLFLVSKPFTTGTQETFRTFAQQIYTSVIDGTFNGGHVEIITKMNNFYQNLVQSDDYEPAKGGKKDQDVSVLQGLIAKLQGQVSQITSATAKTNNGSTVTGGSSKRKCFECGSEDHVVKDCPTKAEKKQSSTTNGSNNGKRPPIADWRKKAPGATESHTKTVEGKEYTWCGKCLQDKGLWTTGKYLHSTAQHKSRKERKENGQQEAGQLAVLPSSPLEVHFG